MFVSRRADGTIFGAWSVRQHEGQEEVESNHPDLAAFIQAPRSGSAEAMQKRQREQALDEFDTAINTLPASQQQQFRLIHQILKEQ